MKTAFLFPGQGSQSIGMGKIAAEKSTAAAGLIRNADEVLGFSLSQVMFEGPEDKLKQTDITQPALFVASAAALELLKERGLKPDWTAGHSLGEYSALYAAGVLGFEDALRLVRARGKAMNEAATSQAGTMAAIIGLAPEKIASICQEINKSGTVCVPANFNSETQTVISGSLEGIKIAMERCLAEGAAKAVQLNVAGAFHSPLMTSAAEAMKPLIDSVSFQETSIPVVTNVDAKPTTRGSEFKIKLVQQIDHSVLWDQSVKTLINQGAEAFIEVGSGRVLSTMAKKLDRKKTVLSTEDMDTIDKTLLLVK